MLYIEYNHYKFDYQEVLKVDGMKYEVNNTAFSI